MSWSSVKVWAKRSRIVAWGRASCLVAVKDMRSSVYNRSLFSLLFDKVDCISLRNERRIKVGLGKWVTLPILEYCTSSFSKNSIIRSTDPLRYAERYFSCRAMICS